ncbi:MAG: 16S rRNA (cytosine(967)-C(5))-methyltransferase RsmB [Clostridia bacterium]|nr:16S rRNA (cytosine(967)-C(5))-methyltransferase RsmB [Clostridia bacterium]
MDGDRKVAYQILMDICKDGAYSNLAIKNHINDQVKNPGFVRELVYGVLENQIYLDKVMDSLTPKGVKGIKEKVLLRMGLYQMKFMDSVPDYAAISETVNLAKKVAYGKDKFINGVLRHFDKSTDFEDLSIKYSFMPWIVDLWKGQGLDVEKLLQASNMRPSLCVRANLSKIETLELMEKLKDFEPRVSDLTPRGIILKGNNIIGSDMYDEGLFSVQDETSIVVADLMEIKKGDKVLDMCAAPGGKSLAMAELGADVLACDIYEHKLDLIQNQANRLGVKVNTRCQDGSEYVDMGTFDKVLCDVPCSGLGVIRHKPEIKLREAQDLEGLYKIQGKILDNAAKYVKRDGILIYSTCTINRKENEDRIERFLKDNEGFRLEFEKQYLPNVDETDGFYIAKLRRK